MRGLGPHCNACLVGSVEGKRTSALATRLDLQVYNLCWGSCASRFTMFDGDQVSHAVHKWKQPRNEGRCSSAACNDALTVLPASSAS